MASKKIVNDLKRKYDKVIEHKNTEEMQMVGLNVQVTLLERTFLSIYTERSNKIDNQTKFISYVIRGLMKRHPDLVKEAKSQIKYNK